MLKTITKHTIRNATPSTSQHAPFFMGRQSSIQHSVNSPPQNSPFWAPGVLIQKKEEEESQDNVLSPESSQNGPDLIQRDPPVEAVPNTVSPEPEPGPQGNSSPNPIADLLRSQLSDSSLRGHLQALGKQLQNLAIEDTAEGDQPAERLVGLSVSRAFSNTAADILQDGDLQHLRQEIERISEDNPGVVLAGALAVIAAMSAAGIGIPLATEQDIETDEGLTVGGAIDLGTLTALQFNKIRMAVGFAQTYFASQVSLEIRQVQEEDEAARNVGQADGTIRIGSQTTALTGRLRMDTEGNLLLEAQLSIDPFNVRGSSSGSQRHRLQLTTGVRYQRQDGENALTIRPGLQGEFRLDANQRLRIGAEAIISPETGLEGLSGSVEYQNRRLFIRFQGNRSGIPDAESIAPGSDLSFQGQVGIDF